MPPPPIHVAEALNFQVVPLASTPPGMPGTYPHQYFGWGYVNRNIPPILLHTFGHSRPILVALRSSRFPSAIRCRQFASVWQADSGFTRLQQCIDECKKAGRWVTYIGRPSCSYSPPVTCNGRRHVTVIQTGSLADLLWCLWIPRRSWWSGTLS